MRTLEQASRDADQLANYSVHFGHPCAFEVVQRARKGSDGELLLVQPFGLHALCKAHKLLYVAPIPSDVRCAS
jgi:hypothetical protein